MEGRYTFVAVVIVLLPNVSSHLQKNVGSTVFDSPAIASARLRSWSSCDEDYRNVTANGTSACNLGYYCTSGTCQCRKAPKRIVDCNKDGFAVLDCHCATFDKTKNCMHVESCVFNCGSTSSSIAVYHHLKNASNSVCEPLQRGGALCGRCLPDHYPLAYSYNMTCIHCRHIRWNWVRYIMAAYLPLTLFYLVILFGKINVVSSHLHPVVLFSQAMSIPPFARIMLLAMSNTPRILTSVKAILSLYGVWNLDFFRPFYSDLCLGIGTLPTLALDYAIAVYPLLLMIISYLLIVLYDRNYRVITVMWKPFRVLFSLFKRNWDIRTSVIDAFSAFFLLTNIKFLSVSFDLLAPIRVYHLYGDTYNYTLNLYCSGDIEYFGREHLPYAILAIVVMCVFVILPIAILALYPFKFFQKFLNLFPVRWYILHTFVDSFQGCYKDGTEPGTRDYRWFSAIYLAFRLISFCLYGVTLNGEYFSLCSVLMLLVVIILVAFQPYKNRVALHFKSNTIFLILYVIFYAIIISIERSSVEANWGYLNFLFIVAIIVGIVPILCIIGFMLYWVFSRCRFCLVLVHRLHWRCRGYLSVGDDDDSYCDRVVNPQAYPTAGKMSSLDS